MSEYTPYMSIISQRKTTKIKKATKNRWKWPNICNIWNLQANLAKTFSSKYTEVIILVLFLWKTYIGAHSNHRKKNRRKPPKMKSPHICLVSQKKKKKNIKSFIRKAILSAEVIGLVVTAYSIDRQNFSHFLPPLA